MTSTTSVSPSQRRDRLPHPRIDGRRPGILQVNVSNRAGVLVRHQQLTRALDDLKRIRHVGRARDAGQVALDLRIARQPLLLVLLLRLQRVRAIRQLVALDDADARRNGADCTQRDHRHCRDGAVRSVTQRERRPRDVHLNVVVGFVECLPDAVEIGMAVGKPRRTIALRVSGDRPRRNREPRARESCDECRHHRSKQFLHGPCLLPLRSGL